MIKLLLALILLTSFPVGYLIAYLCKDELIDGRKWFILLASTSLILSLIVIFLDFSNKYSIILTLLYIAIVSFISVWKSYDKKFLGKYAK